MRLTHKLIGAAGVALAFAGVGTTAAIAGAGASSSPAIKPAVQTAAPTAADTDNVQQGDQTTPDVPGASESPDPTAKTASATVKAAPVAPEPTTAETEKPAASETESPSDGPGGHEDTGTNVDHQFDGQE
ncbi:MAG: hypothetical protein QOH28_2196 [Actinomycetota bacterium]|jgi:hypothetical protein|nr:hypothetical protein [Actinomycetota bacterium]